MIQLFLRIAQARRVAAIAVLLAVASALAMTASAAISPLDFDNAAQQQQYRQLIAEFRCPKCLNQNLAESDAPIAQDLRLAVYELVRAGHSDDEIRAFMQQRYGDFVLYRPPLRADTLLLWFGPAMIGVIGLIVVWRISRQRVTAVPLTLDANAQARVAALLAPDRDRNSTRRDA
jgi:cytochrome c-type biogenesis protein CcmH